MFSRKHEQESPDVRGQSEKISDQPQVQVDAEELLDNERDVALIERLRSAKYAALTSRTCTDAARSFIDDLWRQVDGVKLKPTRGPYKRTDKQRRLAVEGFVGDLLRVHRHDQAQGWVGKSLHAKSFTGEDVGRHAFTDVYKRLVKLGYVEHKKGYRQLSEGFDPGGPKHAIAAYASRFRGTEALLKLSAAHGVLPEDAKGHFVTALPRKPLQLRAVGRWNQYGQKDRGRLKSVPPTEQTARLEQEVRDLNQFYDRFDLRGGTHRGFIRQFNEVDEGDEFLWNKGGRLYSVGDDSYQQMSERERLTMTIDGEAVCEIAGELRSAVPSLRWIT
jgi:hypothetical protein